MAESKIKAEGESNDISAERQGLEVDEATLKGKETVCVPSIQANLCLHLCLHFFVYIVYIFFLMKLIK